MGVMCSLWMKQQAFTSGIHNRLLRRFSIQSETLVTAPFHSFAPRNDGELFSCIQPKIAASSEDLMTPLRQDGRANADDEEENFVLDKFVL